MTRAVGEITAALPDFEVVSVPYCRQTGRLLADAARLHGDEAVYLVASRPDTRWWRDLTDRTPVIIVFLRGRLRFGGAAGAAPFPSALVYRGRRLVEFERLSRNLGIVCRPVERAA